MPNLTTTEITLLAEDDYQSSSSIASAESITSTESSSSSSILDGTDEYGNYPATTLELILPRLAGIISLLAVICVALIP